MLVRNGIYSVIGHDVGTYITIPIYVFEILANFIDDFLVLYLSWMGIRTHMDYYNFGLIAGKAIKIISLFFFQGWI